MTEDYTYDGPALTGPAALQPADAADLRARLAEEDANTVLAGKYAEYCTQRRSRNAAPAPFAVWLERMERLLALVEQGPKVQP